MTIENVYDDRERARAYAGLDLPGTYFLAFRDLPALFEKHVQGRRALDFGCGTGRSTRFLATHGFSAIGVDIAPAMIEHARELDPKGDYRLVDAESLPRIGGPFDLILAAFTFDNIPTDAAKRANLSALGGLLAADGRLVMIVSHPRIYLNEWASFSTRDFPENHSARDGDTVRIIMLDVPDRRPVMDVVCSPEHYARLFERAGLRCVETLEPLGREDDGIAWVSETRLAPWMVHVLAR